MFMILWLNTDGVRAVPLGVPEIAKIVIQHHLVDVVVVCWLWMTVCFKIQILNFLPTEKNHILMTS